MLDDTEVADDLVRDMTEAMTLCARLYGYRRAAAVTAATGTP